MRKALFLDRDGVINKDLGYVYEIQNFYFNDGIFELVKNAKRLGYLIFIITNQSGIARGYFSEKKFDVLMSWVKKKFKDNGASIDKIYHCPYHVDGVIKKYSIDHYDRKPNPGMILKATKEYDIDLKKSILVGDKRTDIQAGINASIPKSIYFGNDEVEIAYKCVKNLKDINNELYN